jgi:membrane complex biogenesis BtpA family protein
MPSPLDPKERLIGVLHLLPTPGVLAGSEGTMEALVAHAVADAEAYVAGGISTLVVENYHDAPFFKDHAGPAAHAAITVAASRVLAVPGVQRLGINVLRNDAEGALGIAAAVGAEFIRVNVHTGSMYTDQGLIEGQAARTIRTRAGLCPAVQIFADVHVKHATPVAGEVLEDAARDAVHRGRADGLIVSGVATGAAPDPERVARVRRAVGDDVPILIGSGFSLGNAASLLAYADRAIVGTAAKEGGDVLAPVCAERVRELVAAAQQV